MKRNKKRLFEVRLEGEDKNAEVLKKMGEDLAKTVETKLEEAGKSLKVELEKNTKVELETAVKEQAETVKVELESSFQEMLNTHKQEVIELTKAASSSANDATEVEKIQLQAINSCLRDGEKQVTLEDFRAYNEKLNLQVRGASRGEEIKLDATIAGYATYDDSKGGALVVPVIDPTIQQDFTEHDTGLFNLINFEPAMSPMKKVVVDTVEPDENTDAVKESLSTIGYELDDGCFVSATVSLKDYFTPARITHNQTEDSAFRIEPYVNGKLALGGKLKIAKDIWVGNAAQKIKGIINYPQGTGYGKVGVKHVATAGTVTMADLIGLCKANRNKGILFVDKATWGTAITEQKDDGDYIFRLGSVQNNGNSPFKFDAVVPFLNVPVVFDDGFTLAEAVAANVVAAILPPSAMIGIKKPTARLTFKNEHQYKEIGLTERYDAVLTKFNYVKLLLNTKAA